MTSVISYEMALLVDRVAKGDISAIGPLWDLLIEEPLDPSRPIVDVAKDLAAALEAYNKDSVVDPTPAPEPAPITLAQLFHIVDEAAKALFPPTPKEKG